MIDPFQADNSTRLARLGELVEKVTGHEKEDLERADPTQLRLAIQRLDMFVEHLEQISPLVEPSEEPGAHSRKDLNAEALAVGVESPEKLPNKQAVIDAIQDAEQAQDAELEGAPSTTSSRI